MKLPSAKNKIYLLRLGQINKKFKMELLNKLSAKDKI
jgi:hypothetical protein